MPTLTIESPTKEQLKHIFKAEDELLKAGIAFDTSHAVDDNGKWLDREWHLDRSLQGAKLA